MRFEVRRAKSHSNPAIGYTDRTRRTVRRYEANRVAKNDRTTSSVTTLAEIFKARDVAHRMVIYEPFTPAEGIRVAAPGHALFSEQGASVWERDLEQFLGRYLGATVSDKRGGAAAPQ